MDDVFNNVEQEPILEEPQGEVVEQPATEPQQVENAPQGALGEPTAPEHGHVPLAALEAVRTEKQDWKAKAIRAEESERQLREQLAQYQQPQQPQQLDPAQYAAVLAQQSVMRTSEMLARSKHGAEKVEAVREWFSNAIANDPSLNVRVSQAIDPWETAVQAYQAQQILAEVGTDPTAYKAKIEAEVRAKIEAERQQSQPQIHTSLGIPKSLAASSVRNAGPRSGPQFTGPPPLESIFP